MEIVSIINQKGGVGKSTTAHALGAGLANMGRKTLLVDIDPQGNLTYSLNAGQIEEDIYSVLNGSDIAGAIQAINNNLDVIISNPALSGADATINETGREYRLKNALEPIKNNYDFIILDTPPALGILTINALTASSAALIPAQADIFSLQGIGQLYNTLNAIKTYTNKELVLLGILLTRYDNRTILTADLTEVIENTAMQLNTKVYNSKIREAIAIKEAQARKEDIFSYAPKSNVTSDYVDFINEFLKDF